MQTSKIKTKALIQSLKPKKDSSESPEERLRPVMEQITLRFDRLSQSINPNDSVQPVRETSYNSLFSLIQAISVLLDLSKPDGLQEFLTSLVSRHVSKLGETFRKLYKDLELPKPQALKKQKHRGSFIPATPPRTPVSHKKEEAEDKENEEREDEDDSNILKSELSKRRRPATNHFTSGLTNKNALFHSVASPKRKRTNQTSTTTYTPKFSKPKDDEEAQEPDTKKSRIVVGEGPFATITSPRRPSPMRATRGREAAAKGRGASSLRSLFTAGKGN